MDIVEQLYLPQNKPLILTIGNFDGVHLGHQHLLQQVVSLAKKEQTRSAAITFKNLPMELFFPERPVTRLCTLNQKIELFNSLGIDTLILLEFTAQFANQTAESFLKTLFDSAPFSHLILGHDARFGKGREGDPTRVQKIARDLGFTVEYIPPLLINGTIVSSRQIRQEIQAGNLELVRQMLGRPYAIQSHVAKGSGTGKKIGFPTANVKVENLCLPPLGVWVVEVKIGADTHHGIANLGFAPTVRNDETPLLEVHLLDHNQLLYGQEIEIAFLKFLRPEQKFSSLEALTGQIGRDVEEAKLFFSLKKVQ